jgi:SpoVK/Ycf46/Vps4 family AAA+-type ATPase
VHGAPGAGKTLLCKSSAGEIGVNMISVSTPELVSGVSGGSEKNIRYWPRQPVFKKKQAY